MSVQVPDRNEIAREHTWAIESVFASDREWEEAAAAAESGLQAIERFRGRLADGPEVLLDAIHEMENSASRVQPVYLYANMQYSVDTGDQAAKARTDRARGLQSRFMAATSFIEPEILEMDESKLRAWLADDQALTLYTHFIESILRQREHVRSAEIEELLGLVGDPFATAQATHRVLTDTDLDLGIAQASDGTSVPIAQGNIATLLSDPDRELRRTAWEQQADAHLAVKNTLANCMSSGVKDRVFLARAHRYPSTLEAALAPHNLPSDVFHTLIATFRKHLPTWHRYWRVRRRALGYDTLHPYDIWAPLSANKPVVTYEKGVDWILAGMQPLGDEYVEVVRRAAHDERWVDIYPNLGKRSGAFSTGAPGTRPFILMSYDDEIFAVSTLAHELGHSLHSYHTHRAQPVLYTNYSMFAAEVASNFNQALVRAHLMETISDRDIQMTLIEEAMSNFHRYFFIMPTLARFELEIHERVERGDGLTADGMIELLAGFFREGYGDEMEVDEARVGITWAEFSTHMYLNFYVWQYATGIAAANALAQGVLAEGRPAAERYLAFLRSGSSVDPLDALKSAGVDMTSPEPVDQAFEVLAGIVGRLEHLVDERDGDGRR